MTLVMIRESQNSSQIGIRCFLQVIRKQVLTRLLARERETIGNLLCKRAEAPYEAAIVEEREIEREREASASETRLN